MFNCREFYAVLKCINCVPAAANLVKIDADFVEKQPKVKEGVLYGPPDTPCPIKKCHHFVFDYNSRVYWSMFIILYS